MIVALRHKTGILSASIVAFGISALLFSGALQVKQHEGETNAARAAVPTQYESEVLANCDMAAFALSPKRVELMSLCSRRLIQTAVLQISACFALLDAIQVADWRAARSLFRWQRDCQRSPTQFCAKRSAWLSVPIG
jgi:hypothetical protein